MLSDMPKKLILLIVGGLCFVGVLIYGLNNYLLGSSVKTLDDVVKTSAINARDGQTRSEENTYWIDKNEFQKSVQDNALEMLKQDKSKTKDTFKYEYLLDVDTLNKHNINVASRKDKDGNAWAKLAKDKDGKNITNAWILNGKVYTLTERVADKNNPNKNTSVDLPDYDLNVAPIKAVKVVANISGKEYRSTCILEHDPDVFQ
jgi:hypothetical protein